MHDRRGTLLFGHTDVAVGVAEPGSVATSPLPDTRSVIQRVSPRGEAPPVRTMTSDPFSPIRLGLIDTVCEGCRPADRPSFRQQSARGLPSVRRGDSPVRGILTRPPGRQLLSRPGIPVMLSHRSDPETSSELLGGALQI